MFAFIDAHLILSIFLFLISEVFIAIVCWLFLTIISNLFYSKYIHYFDIGSSLPIYISIVPIFSFLFRIGLYILGRFIAPLWLRAFLLLISSFFVLIFANIIIMFIDDSLCNFIEILISVICSPKIFLFRNKTAERIRNDDINNSINNIEKELNNFKK